MLRISISNVCLHTFFGNIYKFSNAFHVKKQVKWDERFIGPCANSMSASLFSVTKYYSLFTSERQKWYECPTAMQVQEVSLDNRHQQPTTKITFSPVGDVELKRVQSLSSSLCHSILFVHSFFRIRIISRTEREQKRRITKNIIIITN